MVTYTQGDYSGRAQDAGSGRGRRTEEVLQRRRGEGVFPLNGLRPKFLRSPRGPLWGEAHSSDNGRLLLPCELSAQTRQNGGAFFCSLLARRRRLRALACHLPLMTS